ncbi:PspC domain-containing protein [Microbacterium sp. NPDC089189]|uniref:PspC domain-containing protein n=1 Tax=Microbacterium sp. NPDC089189 TaxID=3154972 RepID=UPI00343DA615
MSDTQHMRLSGHAGTFPLTAEAHSDLVGYLSSSRERLSHTLDADETIRDLEASLGDRLQALPGAPGRTIDAHQMTDVLRTLGSVEPDPDRYAQTGSTIRGRFWSRLDEGKWFGGVCVGLAVRGHLRLDWIRTIGIFLMFLTGGLIGLAYLALWLILPRVETIEEYEQRTQTAIAPKVDTET